MTDAPWNTDGESGCPICNQDVVSMAGPRTATVLLIGDEPSDSELSDGLPFVGPAGGILRTELSFIGIDLKACRRMLLFPHAAKKVDKRCVDYWKEQAIKEAKDRRLVVVFGANAVRSLLDDDLGAIAGLPSKSPYFDATVLPCVKPGGVFGSGVGELRFCLKQLQTLAEALQVFDPKTVKALTNTIEGLEDW